MADIAQTRLCELVRLRGVEVSGNEALCEALLKERLGEAFSYQCSALVAAIKEGVTTDLLKSTSSSLPKGLLMARLIERLQSKYGLTPSQARWVVESWALALGIAQTTSSAGVDFGNSQPARVESPPAPAPPPPHPAGGSVPRVPIAPSPDLPKPPQAEAVTLPSRPAPAIDTSPIRAAWKVASLLAVVAVLGTLVLALVLAGRPPSTAEPARPDPANQERQRTENDARARSEAARRNQVELERQRQIETEQQRAETERQKLRAEIVDREQRVYYASRGNLGGLRAYVSTCTICAYASEARSEIGKLEEAEQEERTYNAAHGNAYALRAYVSACKICAYENAARAEIARLEALEPRRRTGSAVLCGRPVNYVIDATGVTEPQRSFLGVWPGAMWNSRVCGGLIVEAVASDGTARVKYVYKLSDRLGHDLRWREQQQAGTVRSADQLTFQDEDGGRFSFRMTGPNTLSGHFVSPNGAALDTVLTRDVSTVP